MATRRHIVGCLSAVVAIVVVLLLLIQPKGTGATGPTGDYTIRLASNGSVGRQNECFLYMRSNIDNLFIPLPPAWVAETNGAFTRVEWVGDYQAMVYGVSLESSLLNHAKLVRAWRYHYVNVTFEADGRHITGGTSGLRPDAGGPIQTR